MDLQTGKIIEFLEKRDFEKEQRRRISKGKPPLLELGCLPKKNCKLCFGRGYIGKKVNTGRYIPCKCVKN